jgi:lysophospholipase L1-like esterase
MCTPEIMKKYLSLGILIWGFLSVKAQDTEGPARFETAVAIYEAEDKVQPFPDGAVLFVGSSSVRMWTTLDEDFPQVKVVNRGFGGSQFSDLLYYLDRLVTCHNPSKIFIYEGDNDINAGKKPKDILIEAKQVRERIEAKLPGVQVLFISAKPSVARWKLRKKYEQLNSLLALYAADTYNTGFVNVWEPALDENDEVRKDIFLEDNLHMNEKGYAIWKKAIAPFM